MQSLWKQLKYHSKRYLNAKAKTPDIALSRHKIVTVLLQAKKEKLVLCAISNGKTFIGELVKYDTLSQKIILKDFQRNISAIIAIEDISRLTVLPRPTHPSHLKKETSRKQ